MKSSNIRRRRSGRVHRELPIQVSGTDAKCRDFIVPARTLLLSRYGAEIVLMPELIPEQEINIHRDDSGSDGCARVVGLFTKELEGYAYGVEFLDADVNFWGMDFPPPPEPARRVPARERNPANGVLQVTPVEVIVPEPALPQVEPPARADLTRVAARKEPPKIAALKNYAVRLQCPLGDRDQWIILERREESLQKVLETRWDFECPIHGLQQEFPLDVKVTPVAISPWVQSPEPTQRIKIPQPRASLGPLADLPPRIEPRILEVYRVSVRGSDRSGNPFRQSARSVDVSRNGGRLDGVGLLIRPGATIEVQLGRRKALFRVVWTGRFGTPQGNEAGIYCLEPDKNIWGLP